MQKNDVVRRHPFLVFIVGSGFAFIATAALISKTRESRNDRVTLSGAEELRLSYEDDRQSFRNALSSLEVPGPNLRWFPEKNLNERPGEASELLIVPFGPCAQLTGSLPSGYGVISMQINPYLPTVPSSILGSYPSKADARLGAERFCTAWYRNESVKPLLTGRAEHMWFEPTIEQTPALSMSSASEVVVPDPVGSTSGLSTERAQLPSYEEHFFKWSLAINGDEILVGPDGICATLALASAHDPENVHILFADGTQKVLGLNESSSAFTIANTYCHATFHSPQTDGGSK